MSTADPPELVPAGISSPTAAHRALSLRRAITGHLQDLISERIPEAEFARRCDAVWAEAEVLGLTEELQDNWEDCSPPRSHLRLVG